jgi:3',5'-cyclic AMP phosphodiesterase CpdA
VTDPLRILHLSDTHLYGDGRLHYGLVDTLAALDRVLVRAGELRAVDLVVASGDLSDDGSTASYHLLRERLEPWAAERGAVVAYAMGNHDLPDAFEEVLGARETEIEVAGFRVVTVDTTVARAGYGRVDGARLERLRETLSAPSPNGTVVVLHHPPVAPTTGLFDTLRLIDPQPLVDLCSASDVRLILAGHYHHALVTEAGPRGIPVVVAPAVANTTDVLWPPPRERAERGSGFAMIQLPVDASVRVNVVRAPAAGDGETVYDLDADAIARIAADSGWAGGA